LPPIVAFGGRTGCFPDRKTRQRPEEVQEEALKEGAQAVPEEGKEAPGLKFGPPGR
jgi:hypothetical protein